MKDTWLNHNTDKILLFVLVLLTGCMVLYIVYHGGGDQSVVAWGENAFSTVLGALILILTGRIARAGQDAPPSPPANGSDTPAPAVPTSAQASPMPAGWGGRS